MDSVRAALRLRTLGPSGLNPPQIKVIDRLQTLTENGPIAELDVDVWDAPMDPSETDIRDPEPTRDTITEFKQWADQHGYTLRPAFNWRSAESANNERGQVITPLITLAVYTGEHLQAVYPHMDGDDVWTIHDGIEVLESMTRDAERSDDENSENPVLPLP